jgi:hypothetical protein
MIRKQPSILEKADHDERVVVHVGETLADATIPTDPSASPPSVLRYLAVGAIFGGLVGAAFFRPWPGGAIAGLVLGGVGSAGAALTAR